MEKPNQTYEIKVSFICDIEKNEKCNKANCICNKLNGCQYTTDIRFAKNITQDIYDKLVNYKQIEHLSKGNWVVIEGHKFTVQDVLHEYTATLDTVNKVIYLSEEV